MQSVDLILYSISTAEVCTNPTIMESTIRIRIICMNMRMNMSMSMNMNISTEAEADILRRLGGNVGATAVILLHCLLHLLMVVVEVMTAVVVATVDVVAVTVTMITSVIITRNAKRDQPDQLVGEDVRAQWARREILVQRELLAQDQLAQQVRLGRQEEQGQLGTKETKEIEVQLDQLE